MSQYTFNIRVEDFEDIFIVFKEEFKKYAYPDGLPLRQDKNGKVYRMSEDSEEFWHKKIGDTSDKYALQILGSKTSNPAYFFKKRTEIKESDTFAKINGIILIRVLDFLGTKLPNNSDIRDLKSKCESLLNIFFKRELKKVEVSVQNFEERPLAKDWVKSSISELINAQIPINVELPVIQKKPTPFIECDGEPISEAIILTNGGINFEQLSNQDILGLQYLTEKFWRLLQAEKLEEAWRLLPPEFEDNNLDGREHTIEFFSAPRELSEIHSFNFNPNVSKFYILCNVFYKCAKGFPELRRLVYNEKHFLEQGLASLRLFLVGFGIKKFDPTLDEIRNSRTIKDFWQKLSDRSDDEDRLRYLWLMDSSVDIKAVVLQNCAFRFFERDFIFKRMELSSVRFFMVDEFGDRARRYYDGDRSPRIL